MLFLIFVTPFAISSLACYFISFAVRDKLTNKGNKKAKTISLIVGFFTFLLVFAAICTLILYNVHLER